MFVFALSCGLCFDTLFISAACGLSAIAPDPSLSVLPGSAIDIHRCCCDRLFLPPLALCSPVDIHRCFDMVSLSATKVCFGEDILQDLTELFRLSANHVLLLQSSFDVLKRLLRLSVNHGTNCVVKSRTIYQMITYGKVIFPVNWFIF